MKRNIIGSVVLVSAMLLSVAAMAPKAATANSDDPALAKCYRAQAGVFIPYKKDFRDLTESTQLTLGLGYDFSRSVEKTTGKAVVYGVYADFTTSKRHGNEVTTTGAGLDGRYYFAPLNTNSIYLGLGIGGYNVRSHSDATGSENNTKIGGKLMVGYECKNGYFIEGSYTTIESSKFANTTASIDPSGYSIVVGTKF